MVLLSVTLNFVQTYRSHRVAERLRDGQVLIGFLQPLTDPQGIERLSQRGVVAFAMESIPRITRAQPMDALSSQANVAGYAATLIATRESGRFFGQLFRKVAISRFSRNLDHLGHSPFVAVAMPDPDRPREIFSETTTPRKP